MSLQQQGNILLHGTGSASGVGGGVTTITLSGGGRGKHPGVEGNDDDGDGNILTTLNPHDVLLGRGNGVNNRAGNVNFRKLVESHRESYTRARRQDKVAIARAVVDHVHSKGGRFLKLLWTGAGGETVQNEGDDDSGGNKYHETYQQISQARAIEKACQALREGCSGRKQQRAFVKAALALRNGSGRLKRGLGKKADEGGSEATAAEGSIGINNPPAVLNNFNSPSATNIPATLSSGTRPPATTAAASAAVAAHAAFAAAASVSGQASAVSNAANSSHYAAIKSAYYNHDNRMNSERVRHELMSRVMMLSKAASSQWDRLPASAATSTSTTPSSTSPSTLLSDSISPSMALLQMAGAKMTEHGIAAENQNINNKGNLSSNQKHPLQLQGQQLPSPTSSKKFKSSAPTLPQPRMSDSLPLPESSSPQVPVPSAAKAAAEIQAPTTTITKSTCFSCYDNMDWEDMYKQVLRFREEVGHCAVPPIYEQNQKLADWACYQRQSYREIDKGFQEGTPIEISRIKRLQQIQFCWDYNEWHWEHQHQELCNKLHHQKKAKEEQNEKEEQKLQDSGRDQDLDTQENMHGNEKESEDEVEKEQGNEQTRQKQDSAGGGRSLEFKNCLDLALWVKDQRQQYADSIDGNGYGMAEERIQKLESVLSCSTLTI